MKVSFFLKSPLIKFFCCPYILSNQVPYGYFAFKFIFICIKDSSFYTDKTFFSFKKLFLSKSKIFELCLFFVIFSLFYFKVFVTFSIRKVYGLSFLLSFEYISMLIYRLMNAVKSFVERSKDNDYKKDNLLQFLKKEVGLCFLNLSLIFLFISSILFCNFNKENYFVFAFLLELIITKLVVKKFDIDSYNCEDDFVDFMKKISHLSNMKYKFFQKTETSNLKKKTKKRKRKKKSKINQESEIELEKLQDGKSLFSRKIYDIKPLGASLHDVSASIKSFCDEASKDLSKNMLSLNKYIKNGEDLLLFLESMHQTTDSFKGISVQFRDKVNIFRNQVDANSSKLNSILMMLKDQIENINCGNQVEVSDINMLFEEQRHQFYNCFNNTTELALSFNQQINLLEDRISDILQ